MDHAKSFENNFTLYLNWFWHGYENCKVFRFLESRPEWWQNKLVGNSARNSRNQQAVNELGWKLDILWKCELKNARKQAKHMPIHSMLMVASLCLRMNGILV
jgi:G:T-mismatch repair DNA endonuclease (very short patch repair protein)